MATDDPRSQRLAAITGLATEVEKLGVQVGGLGERIDRLWKRSRRHAGWIVFDIALSFGLVFFYDQNSDLIAQQARTTDRLEVSVQESCGLYSLFLGSYRPESRTPGPDRDTYERSFAQLRESYRKLECQGPIVPPATPSPPR